MRGSIAPWLTFFSILLSLPLHAVDYYWVGGAGNWSDISHWATSSGGTITHNITPTAEDNVIFDENSFTGPDQVVTLNLANAFCLDMDWAGVTNNPTLVCENGNTLNVHGSLRLVVDMTVDFRGKVNFLSEAPDNEIDMAGHSLNGAVLFEGAGGDWKLLSAFSVSGDVRLVDGMLNTRNQAIDCGNLTVEISGQGTLQLGTSSVTVGKNVRIDTDNLTLEASQAPFELTGAGASFTAEGANAAIFNTLRFINDGGAAALTGPDNPGSSFQEVSFAGNGRLAGNLQVGLLELAAGRIYTLRSGNVYEVDALTATGECVKPIQLFGSDAGAAAVLQSDAASIEVAFVSLKDIHATGGASFTANNSADLGNNQGWTINSRADNDLYWVGGAGNWDDPAHWSLSSGGPGGACIPTGADNVIFDANSFDDAGGTVTLNVQNAFCRDMTWTDVRGLPAFWGGNGNTLRVYGSLTLAVDMDLQIQGDVRFESPRTGNTINTAGHLLQKDVYLDGFNGGWVLADSLSLTGTLQFRQGDFQTLDHKINCTNFQAGTSGPRLLELGASTVNLGAFGGNAVWEVNLDSLDFNPGTSFLHFLDNGQVTHSGKGAVDYYDITFDEVGVIDAGQNDGMSIRNLTFVKSGTVFHAWTMERLELTKGYEYRLDVDNVQDIGELVADGACDAYISIRSVIDDVPAPIRSDQSNTAAYLILKDIHVRSGQFTADSSIDLGNNDGWTINTAQSRTLYWVGGGGDWQESIHWSLSSGGPGGECIPTPADDVIFDANSFNADGQVVTGMEVLDHFCRNMTWENLTAQPVFDMLTLQLFGSLELAVDMTVSINQLRLRGESAGLSLQSNGHSLSNLIAEGSGTWKLTDAMTVEKNILLLNGTLDSDGQPLTAGSFKATLQETPKTLRLGNSLFTITGGGFSWEVNKSDFTLDAATSSIEFTNPKANMRNSIPLAFHNVLFTASSGRSELEGTDSPSTFNLVRFNKDGLITGVHTFDTLVFSPGKAYTLQAEVTQTITKHLQIFGNNCQPIKLSSTRTGVQSTIFMMEGVVNGDFIQMRDQRATGGATFFAGIHSTDIGGSNTDWIFESSETFVDVGFLGTDRVLCEGEAVTIDANNNSNNETYQWQDGSNSATYVTSDPGTFWVQVSFGAECEIRDSVVVLPPEEFNANLPSDTTLCEGDEALLDATLDVKGVRYEWQDGSTASIFEVREVGLYSVELTLNGCTHRDTTLVDYVESPSLDLGSDTTLCHETTLGLDAGRPEATGYRWQDGSTGSSFTVSAPGTYWADLQVGGCTTRDSITVDYYGPINPDLGADTTACDSEAVTLAWPKEGASYSWSDGSTNERLQVEQAGIYWVDVRLNGCVERDSIQIDFRPAPQIEVGSDTMICEGTPYTLEAQTNGDSFFWQDGSSSLTLTVTEPGVYWAEATLNGCLVRDTAIVEFQVPQIIDLGPDTTICQDETYVLDPGVQGDRYQWQDGSTGSTYRVAEPGIYSVEIVDGSCVLSDMVMIQQRECTYFTYYMPNAFSPNGDGVNDRLQISFPPELEVLRFQVNIFDRWGNMLFQSSDPDMIWDGTYRSQSLPMGVYVYAIELEYIDDREQNEQVITGDVLLVR